MSNVISVGANRMVAIRYVMKNSAGEILVNTMENEPVKFLYGSGEIVPGLESALQGLRIGDRKSFSLSKNISPALDQSFYFDVVVDDIWWMENERDPAQKKEAGDCGPGCAC